MKKGPFSRYHFTRILSKKLPLIMALVGILMISATYFVYSRFFAEAPPIQESAPAPSPSESPTPSVSPSPSPTPSLTPKPAASAKPVSTSLFKITAPSTWDTQKITRYVFSAYAYEPIKTMTITFNDSQFELTPDSRGNFSKVIDISVGKTVITVTAMAVSGKTEVQTYTVTKNDTLSQVDPKLTGVQCDGAKLDDCGNYSGYSPGKCSKYSLYLECLRTKCDVNTLTKDPSCKSQQ